MRASNVLRPPVEPAGQKRHRRGKRILESWIAAFVARLPPNVIRRLLRIVDTASTRASVRESHLRCCLAPVPVDRRASRYFENEKLFPDALNRSNDQPVPAISNCARGL